MSTYIAGIKMLVGSKEITDFKKVSVKAIPIRKAVELMNKTGTVKLVKRYSGTLDYVIPSGGAFNWEGVEDAQLTLIYDDGSTESYAGVSVTIVGEKAADGQNEIVQVIDWMAERKN